ncbi:DNA-3-methyladenine glycosylase 2 family protein [Glutamicibacter sp. X7]
MGENPVCAPGERGFEERYRAIDARDARFDGQFYTAVSSTGIYCRPSCPARTPKREHVRFYLTSAAAHEAGYRACKRCLPEAVPGTPQWDIRSDTAARAMRLINDGVIDRQGVEGLAMRLGYTPRHLNRLLVSELGAGALALARARRAQSARALLTGTDLPLGQVAFAAGFGSVRQFNDCVREVFDATPSQLRARAHRRPANEESADGTGAADAVLLDIDLPVRQPYDAPGLYEFLAHRALRGIESVELSAERLRYARTLRLPGGPGAFEVLAERVRDGQWQLRGRLELSRVTDVAPALARLRRVFDLDADPAAVDQALSAVPVLQPLIAARPGARVPGAADPQEMVVRAQIGQQISVAAARGHLNRLVAHAGEPYSSRFMGLDRLFPTNEQILQAVPEVNPGEPLDPERVLRLPGQASNAIRTSAQAMISGALAVDCAVDGRELTAQLVALPRIGPWTAGYIALRVLADPDAWMPGDVALLAGARSLGLIDPSLKPAAAHRALSDFAAEHFAPWRSYASLHLWSAALTNPTPRRRRTES